MRPSSRSKSIPSSPDYRLARRPLRAGRSGPQSAPRNPAARTSSRHAARFDRAAPEELAPPAAGPSPRRQRRGMVARSRLGSSLALERIQHPQRRSEPCLLRRRRAGRTESRLHRSRRPRNRPRQPPPAGRSRHRRCSKLRSSLCKQFHSNLVVEAARSDAARQRPAPRRRPNHRRAGSAARHANRRLHPGAGCRSQTARRRRFPRRLARNR